MQILANPARFTALARAVEPWAFRLAGVGFAVGLVWGLVLAPEDYQQGDTVRIMYVHVPAAWLSMGAYAAMAVASLVALIWRHPVAELSAKGLAPVGALFTALALATGMLWGEPMWGTWWVWDARLTSVLLLLFLYLGYMALWQAIEDPVRAGRATSILCLMGAVNLPVIKFSVDWWNTLHQGASVFRFDGPTIHPDILWPLMVMALAGNAFLIGMAFRRTRLEILRRKLDAMARADLGAVAGPARVTLQEPERQAS